MILNVVVGPPREVLGDLGPAISQLFMSFDDHHVLLISPLVLLNVWVQVIVPPIN